ncbi:hypothetical protein J4443_03910 [Candidatus Woesearchaeota archaeon]|nr:hypothetical protein [Candidatus Woesearchaeota archaeon]
MVSLGAIKENFGNFINEVSKKKKRRLTQGELHNFSEQSIIFIRLLNGKALISEANTLDRIRKGVAKTSFIEESDVKDLKKILNAI